MRDTVNHDPVPQKISPGVFDKTEIHNIPKFIPAFERPKPEIENKSRPIIEGFALHIHHEIARKLFILLIIILELLDDYIFNIHCYEKKSDCHLHYMKYHRRAEEENEKAAGI